LAQPADRAGGRDRRRLRAKRPMPDEGCVGGVGCGVAHGAFTRRSFRTRANARDPESRGVFGVRIWIPGPALRAVPE
jgi:hypothetical protein